MEQFNAHDSAGRLIFIIAWAALVTALGLIVSNLVEVAAVDVLLGGQS